MDEIVRTKVIQRLRNGPAFDQHAEELCVLMTSAPNELHDQEQKFTVAREGKFDLLISAHHRQVRAVYSHVFVGEQSGMRGRYQFYLKPMSHEIQESTPRSLLTLLINSNGLFTVDGQEMITDPPPFQRSPMRNWVMTSVIAGLQKALTVQVPE